MWLERELWLLQLTGVDGRVGVGEAVLDGDATEVMETLSGGAGPRSRRQRERPASCRPARISSSTARPGRALNAALEAASLDLESVRPTSTGRRCRGRGQRDPAVRSARRRWPRRARQSVEAGFATLKLKGGAERETDVLVERVAGRASAVGPDVALRPRRQRRVGPAHGGGPHRGGRPVRPDYVEQPLPPVTTTPLAELRRRVRVPIAADESVESVRAARDLTERDAADVLVVKLARRRRPLAARGRSPSSRRRTASAVVMSNLFESGVGIAGRDGRGGQDCRPSARTNPPDHGLATAGLLEHDLLAHSR
jgi:L-alanine-DL-glutamate epimerase-like enolase superfamily enzyme